MTRRGVTVLLVLALAGGCTRGGGTGADPTVPAETSPPTAPSTSTSAPPDIATIPAVIEQAYLDRVLAAIDEIDGRATRIIVEQKRLVPEAAELLAAIYDDEEFSGQTHVWATTIDRDPTFAGFKPDPGARRTTVSRIISGSPVCVWMAVTRDYSAVAARARSPQTEYVAVRPLDKANDPKGLNPTAWMITLEGYNRDGSEPEDPCVEG